MPLIPDPQHRFANYNVFNIRFPMFDHEKQVVCTVSSAALQDIAAAEGREREPIEELFKIYRPRVEAIASKKYDEGTPINGEVRVVNGDV